MRRMYSEKQVKDMVKKFANSVIVVKAPQEEPLGDHFGQLEVYFDENRIFVGLYVWDGEEWRTVIEN